MNGHELARYSGYLYCTCNDWAMWPGPGVEDAWAEHREHREDIARDQADLGFDDEDEAAFDMNREGMPEFNGAFG